MATRYMFGGKSTPSDIKAHCWRQKLRVLDKQVQNKELQFLQKRWHQGTGFWKKNSINEVWLYIAAEWQLVITVCTCMAWGGITIKHNTQALYHWHTLLLHCFMQNFIRHMVVVPHNQGNPSLRECVAILYSFETAKHFTQSGNCANT